MERAPADVVFFDGQCGLCNRTVNLLIRIDAGRRLRYAPLQGESARARFPHLSQVEPSSILFWSDGALHERSRAVRRILLQLGGVYAAIGKLLGLIPPRLADRLYAFVARHRHRVFGRSDVCRLPSPEVSRLFLP